MNNPQKTYPAVIVGGGPVGLFLGICLEQAGISCRILEKRPAPTGDSRSLGIHPPSLELLDAAGITGQLVREGVRISRGHAFAQTQKIGSLSFEECPPPFNFVLSLPQSRTEQLLEAHLHQLNSRVLIRGAEVVDFIETQDHQTVTYRIEGATRSIRAKYVIGCDGKESFIRHYAGISFEGKTYPDTYVMGDFADNTDFGSDAAIFLCEEGLIESFPLPGNRRRWVVKTDNYHSTDQRRIIEKAVHQRIQHPLFGIDHFMLSSFGVEKRVAGQMVKKRSILAGDAAHVVSPIGGQGMNLGWLGAWDLSQCLRQMFDHSSPRNRDSELLKGFEQRRKKAARNAAGRGEFNMRMGRKVPLPAVRNGIVSLMLNTPLSRLMARLFTMRGLDRWII
ncbi:2-polyprenyl-6-methoxyphenol hydroxylase [Fodinibius roseus]|uniref:2-polyprenyl-6-methoxyphenol hydroxylase n=1 Tax=Fodinibius roseus TaxID=1194090 RepID=A0A1M4WL48_9BACT|nr:NAD(P)/FAD-dependent oxidoreductase [Fodinibius roseus]SHE81946.1 2-polyprenyl-6-methoxyphenol hydroxylase [Fodinibius roseus]